ncbi:hypothetical protein KW787_01490 [Candidatus Pacearchaeota archaeon]|nr:hypothetical protein [Candidatus Pacearchaeota archaeon]
MILSKKPLSIADVQHYVKKSEDKKPIDEYLKHFGEMSQEKAHKISESIRKLNNPKITEEDIIKIVDFLPQDAEDLHKIFNQVGLSEEEISKLLQLVKEK